MLTLSYPICEGIAASLDTVVPDGYAVRLAGTRPGLVVDHEIGMTAIPCFTSLLVPFARRAVVGSAECAMAVVEDFVSGQEGGRAWLDPYNRCGDGIVVPRAFVRDGRLHMEFGCAATLLARLPPVDLPPGWC